MTANFNKDNLKEGMTVYLLYTGYDLSVGTVSYTHLDVYKRQILLRSKKN